MEFFIALLMVLGLLGLIVVFYYNKIVKLKVHVKEGWSDIQIQLKRRHNLVENLVNTVKGYAKHESSTLEKVVEARSAAKQAEGGNPGQVQAAESMLTTALKGLNINALVESYPDLKANENFQQLQAELSDIENKIAASRRFYNSTVTNLNTTIQQFPGNLFAGLAKAEKAEFFEVEMSEQAEVNKTPKVSFEDKPAEKPQEPEAPKSPENPKTEEKPDEEKPAEEKPTEQKPADDGEEKKEQ